MEPKQLEQGPDPVAIARWLDAQEEQNKQAAEMLVAVKNVAGETKEAIERMVEIHAQTAQWMTEIRTANAKAEDLGLKPAEIFGTMIACHTAAKGDAAKTLQLMSDNYKVDASYLDRIEREMSIGSPSGGGIIVPDVVFDEMVPFFRFTATIFQLGCRLVQLGAAKTTIPRLLSGTMATWELENIEIGLSDDLKWGSMEMTPHKLGVRLRASNSFMKAGKSAPEVLAMDAAAAYAQEWSRCAMNGSGIKRPKGIFHPSFRAMEHGIAEYNGDIYVDKRQFWAEMKKAFRKANKGQIGLGNLGWVFNEDVTCVLEGSETSLGTAKWNLEGQKILGIPYQEDFQLVTTDNAHDTTQIALADWSEMFVGTSRQPELLWSTHSRLGYDQTEMLLVGEGDTGPRQLRAFCLSETGRTVP